MGDLSIQDVSRALVKIMPRRLRFMMFVLLGKEISAKVEVACNRERLGSEYGGYWICPDDISPHSIVYSFGVGKDITFELDLIKKHHCKVFAFDPIPNSIGWVKRQDLPRELSFFPLGLADSDGKVVFHSRENQSPSLLDLLASTSIEVEVRKLSSIMKMLKHDSIDLLKLDVEGAEYRVISDIFRDNLSIKQICLEFHHRLPPCSLQDTIYALKTLRKMGFRLFWQEYDVFSFRLL